MYLLLRLSDHMWFGVCR